METFVIVMVLLACIAAMAAAISSFISENFIAGALWTIIAILWGSAGFRISEKISNTEKAKIESVQYEKCPAIDSTILIHGTDTVVTYSIKYE